MNWEIFAVPVFLGVTISVLGWFYKTYPPKKINWWYGYRTKRTMANQEAWDFANKIGGKFVFYHGVFTLFAGSLATLLLTEEHLVVSLSTIILLGIAVGFYWCETQLNRQFDKNGNRK